MNQMMKRLNAMKERSPPPNPHREFEKHQNKCKWMN